MAIERLPVCPSCNTNQDVREHGNMFCCDECSITFNETEASLEKVSTQEHYTQFKIQVIEFCQVNKLSWCASNVVKYVCREEKKNGLEDLYKAMDYLRCLIHYKETGKFVPPNELNKEK